MVYRRETQFFGLVDVSFMVFLTVLNQCYGAPECFSVQTDGDLPGGIQLDQTMFIGGIN
jgi:hypothetical protein